MAGSFATDTAVPFGPTWAYLSIAEVMVECHMMSFDYTPALS